MVLPRQTNIVSIWLIWPRRIKYILAWETHLFWVGDMWWTRLDVGRIARRIVPRIDFLQSNRRNASKLGQKKSIFSRKCGTGRHRDLGVGRGGYHFSYLSPNNQPPLYQDGHFLSSALPSWRSDHLRQDQLQQLNIKVGKNKKPTLEIGVEQRRNRKSDSEAEISVSGSNFRFQ